MHVDQGEARQQQLRTELATLRKSKRESMLAYTGRALSIKTELTNLDSGFKDVEVVRQVLAGLRDDIRYATVSKIITLSPELPTLSKLSELLVEEERLLGAAPERDIGDDPLVLAARGQRSTGDGPRRCWKCEQTGHIAARCPKIRCFECGGRGHIAKHCPKQQRNGAVMTAIAF